MIRIDRRRLIATAGAGLALSGQASPLAAEAAEDMSLGNARAKVKVVEYASASCNHCARFNNEIFPAFRQKYIDTGKVHYTLKEFITAPAEFAAAGFLLARCAGKDRYFPVIDAVFRAQDEIYQTRDLRGGLLKIAQANGVDEAKFEACLTDDAAIAALNERARKSYEDDGITATPTFVINGKKVKEGVMTLAELDQAIAQASK